MRSPEGRVHIERQGSLVPVGLVPTGAAPIHHFARIEIISMLQIEEGDFNIDRHEIIRIQRLSVKRQAL